MTTEDQITRDDVIEKLAALLAAWEQGFVSNPDDAEYGVSRIKRAGDAYVEALAAFIDSRARAAVLSFATDPRRKSHYDASANPLPVFDRNGCPVPQRNPDYAKPFVTHFLTEDLVDACGHAPSGVKVTFTAVSEDVTCPDCREIIRIEAWSPDQ